MRETYTYTNTYINTYTYAYTNTYTNTKPYTGDDGEQSLMDKSKK